MKEQYGKPVESNFTTLESELREFQEVDNFISCKNYKEFYDDLPEIGAVYVFVADKPIGRLVGESSILKIGETKNFKKRMIRYFRVQDLNTIKDKPSRQTAYHLRNYLDGKTEKSVKLLVKYYPKYSKKDLKNEERRLLTLFLKEHYEVPPLNMGLR